MKEKETHCILCRELELVNIWIGKTMDYFEENVFEIKYCRKCHLGRTFSFQDLNKIISSPRKRRLNF